MRNSAVVEMNFTHTTLLALKCIEYAQSVSRRVVQEALRHLLIVDCIQKGQIIKIVLENETLIAKI